MVQCDFHLFHRLATDLDVLPDLPALQLELGRQTVGDDCLVGAGVQQAVGGDILRDLHVDDWEQSVLGKVVEVFQVLGHGSLGPGCGGEGEESAPLFLQPQV